MIELNGTCTGTNSEQAPLEMFYEKGVTVREISGNNKNPIYAYDIFTQTNCPRADKEGNCSPTGKPCNAPLYVTLQTKEDTRHQVDALLQPKEGQ